MTDAERVRRTLVTHGRTVIDPTLLDELSERGGERHGSHKWYFPDGSVLIARTIYERQLDACKTPQEYARKLWRAHKPWL